jgi:hypothetical protein
MERILVSTNTYSVKSLYIEKMRQISPTYEKAIHFNLGKIDSFSSHSEDHVVWTVTTFCRYVYEYSLWKCRSSCLGILARLRIHESLPLPWEILRGTCEQKSCCMVGFDMRQNRGEFNVRIFKIEPE